MKPDPYHYAPDFDEEVALASLLLDGVLFSNSREYIWANKSAGDTVCLFVLLNDIFVPAADACDLPWDQIKALYDANKADVNWGVVKWAARRLGCKPWSRRQEQMKAAGAWESWMDELKESRV